MLSVRAARRTPACQAQMVRLPPGPVLPADPAERPSAGRPSGCRDWRMVRLGTRAEAARAERTEVRDPRTCLPLALGPPSRQGGECARHDRVVRAQQRRRQPDDGVHRGQRAPRGDERQRGSVSGDGARPDQRRGSVSGRRPRGGGVGGDPSASRRRSRASTASSRSGRRRTREWAR